MKLEVGKYYKNNWYKKCYIVWEDKETGFFLAVHFHDNGSHQCTSRHLQTGESVDCFDVKTKMPSIVAEWVEPVEHEVMCWFYKNRSDGRIEVYTSRPTMALIEPIAGVKVKFTEGDGL